MGIELGSVLLGSASLIGAVWAIVQARHARRDATEAMAMSPTAQFEGLREQIKELGRAYADSMSRNATEREGMEASLMRQRERAEAAEHEAFSLRGQVATLSVGLTEAQQQIAELRLRFDASLNR